MGRADKANGAAIKTAALICLKPNSKASVLPVVRVVDKAFNSLAVYISVSIVPTVWR
jgi:hypothetical protein